jgi:hypothetical protein
MPRRSSASSRRLVKGRVYFDKGRMVHAETSNASGEKALSGDYRIYRWTQ